VVTAAQIEAALNGAGLDRYGLDEIAVRIVEGGLRLALRARIGDAEAELTCKAAFEGLTGGLWRVALRDIRLHGAFPVPAPLLLAALPAAFGLLAAGRVEGEPTHFALTAPPLVRTRGVTEWDVDVAGLALLNELVSAGYRLPARAGLVSAPVERDGDRLVFRLIAAHEGTERATTEPVTSTPQLHVEEGIEDRGLAALAEVAFCGGEVRAAAEGFRRALDAEPDNGFARERLLQLLATFPEARLDLEALADETIAKQSLTEVGVALVAKAVVALDDERETEAAWLYARLAAGAAAHHEPLDEAAARLAGARVLMKSGDDEAALTALERVLVLRPTHAGARMLLERLRTSPAGEPAPGSA
jgi:tetratricopeptide (TPR) repeat protein